MSETGRCSHCREWIGVYMPRGGDGSVVLTRVHNVSVGVRCPGSKTEPLDLDYDAPTP